MTSSLASLGTAALCGALLVGCGDPAVDGSYEGEALLQVRGLLCAFGEMDVPTASVGIMWTTLNADGTLQSSTPGEAQLIDARELPADFRVGLHEHPPAGAVTRIGGNGLVAELAIGIPVLFDDADLDGELQLSERVLGVGRGHVVTHTGNLAPGSDAVALAVGDLPAGFSLAQTVCDADRVIGFDPLPLSTRIDVWLFDGIADNPIEGLAPTTCLAPF